MRKGNFNLWEIYEKKGILGENEVYRGNKGFVFFAKVIIKCQIHSRIEMKSVT